MEEELLEYTVFTVVKKDGTEAEMAVMDEFDFEDAHYVVGALVEGDTINEDGLYIYKAVESEEDFEVEKIPAEEYDKIVEAYMEIAEEAEEE